MGLVVPAGDAGLEDIKSTDPVQHFSYMFLLRGYLEVDPSSPDLMLRNVERPYFDFLNVRWLDVPPDHAVAPPGFVERYRGADGVVLENVEALPRYFLVHEAAVEPDLGAAIAKSRAIVDYRAQTIVDRKPREAPLQFAGGEVKVVRYDANRTTLDVDSRGWNLLVTSDAYWPGWNARINGRPAEIVKILGTFIGVYLPPGQARVELWYWPDELTHGLYAALVGLLAFGVILSAVEGSTRRTGSRE